MNIAHIAEIADAMRSPVAPRGAKVRAHRFGEELKRQCYARPHRSTRVERRHLDALLSAAVEVLREAMARDLREARRRAVVDRGAMAEKLGRTASFVARAERGEAAFDLATWLRVRRICRSRRSER